MKNKDLIKLEEAYSSVNNKQVIEEAPVPDTDVGNITLMAVMFAIPFIIEGVLKMIPVIKGSPKLIESVVNQVRSFVGENGKPGQYYKQIKSVVNSALRGGESTQEPGVEQKPNIANEVLRKERTTPRL
jgi:hypothetical protein